MLAFLLEYFIPIIGSIVLFTCLGILFYMWLKDKTSDYRKQRLEQKLYKSKAKRYVMYMRYIDTETMQAEYGIYDQVAKMMISMVIPAFQDIKVNVNNEFIWHTDISLVFAVCDKYNREWENELLKLKVFPIGDI